MKNVIAVLVLFAGPFRAGAADLTLSGEQDKVYENQTYGKLSINSCRNITIRNCTFQGYGNYNGNQVANISGTSGLTLENCIFDGAGTSCNGMNMGGSNNVTVSGCTIRNVADDGLQINSCNNILLENNRIHTLLGCGTDGGCGPCYNGHSSGMELVNVTTCVIRGNLIYDMRGGTGAFTPHEGDNRDFVITNNIFYTPKCAISTYIMYISGVKVFNNIFWNGHWHGLAIGRSVTGLELKNNIIKSIDFTHLGATYNPAQHDIDYNIIAAACGGYTVSRNNIFFPAHRFTVAPHAYSSEELTDITAEDFSPLSTSKTIDAGYAGSGVPATDLLGSSRVDVGSIVNSGTGTSTFYDIGPIEYVENNGIDQGWMNRSGEPAEEMVFDFLGKKVGKGDPRCSGVYIVAGGGRQPVRKMMIVR